MHIKYYPVRGSDDKRAYIVRNVRGAKARDVVERYGSVKALEKEHGDAKAFLEARARELEKAEEGEVGGACSITIDPGAVFDPGADAKLWKNTGYLFLQKAYYDLGIEPFLNKWKHESGLRIGYSLNDAFRLMVYSRVIDPCSKAATARKKDDYAEPFDLTEDDLYDCLGRADDFSARMTARLSSACRELMPKAEIGGDAVFYDCTNFHFECEEADGEGGLRDFGVEKNHRPDPIVEYGLLLDGSGFPLGSCCFRGNESEKRSLIPLLAEAGEEATKARIIVADAGLNTEANKDAIHGSGRNYIFCQSPRMLSAENAEKALEDEGWTVYDGGRKKVRSVWVQRSNGREERLVVRFDQASADFVNKAVDKRVERAKKLMKSPSRLSFSRCQDGKELIKKVAFDKETGELIKEKSELVLDEAKIAEERKWAGYTIYATDIPRDEDIDKEFEKMKAEGLRVKPETDISIAQIAGRRNDIESCFRVMKTNMDARPLFVWTPAHIRGHLFTVYVALTLVMYIRAVYAGWMSPDALIEALRRCGFAVLDEKRKLYQATYYSPDVEKLRVATGLAYLNRKYMTWPMLKKTIAMSKGR